MQHILYATTQTPWGAMQVEATEEGITAIYFTNTIIDQEDDHSHLQEAKRALAQFINGTNFLYKLPLVLSPSPLQRAVWEAVQSIQPGSTASYQAIADAAGYPRAVRAVASAVGANPFALVLPCHRVVLSSGRTGEYAWGAERKAAILAHEAACVAAYS